MLNELREKLQAEVERLNHEINFVLPKEIEKARAHGDLRENSEYKAALERQQFAQARASHLRLRLSKLSSVKEGDIPRDRVGFGSRVTVQDLDTKKRETYALTLGFALVYLGEHYVVDLVAGAALTEGVRRVGPRAAGPLREIGAGVRRLEVAARA